MNPIEYKETAVVMNENDNIDKEKVDSINERLNRYYRKLHLFVSKGH